MRNPQRTRYYITKSGETPTVRSVRVALNDCEPRNEPESTAATPEASLGSRPDEAPATGVKRRVQNAIRRRVDR